MIYIKSPNDADKQLFDYDQPSFFMAGGLTDCPPWHDTIFDELGDEDIILVNPRRTNYDSSDKKMEIKQIEWEYKYLNQADYIIFWFPKETLCPITLYELGFWANGDKHILVGVHPEYARKTDVEVQLRLKCPEVKIVYSIKDLTNQLKEAILDYKEFDKLINNAEITFGSEEQND